MWHVSTFLQEPARPLNANDRIAVLYPKRFWTLIYEALGPFAIARQTAHILNRKMADICPRCGSRNLIADHYKGEVICADCGCVIKEKVEDLRPEWRAYDKEEKEERNRAGAPLSMAMYDKGLSTVMSLSSNGKPLTGPARERYMRLKRLDSRSTDGGERRALKGLMLIQGMASKLGLGSGVVEEAAQIFRQASEMNLLMGRKVLDLAAASLYAVCRLRGIPRTDRDLAAVAGIKRKGLHHTYRIILKHLNLKPAPPSPEAYLDRMASMAGVSEHTKRLALKIIAAARKRGFVLGKGPLTVAASALYLACTRTGELKTQKDIAEAAGITETTLRSNARKLVGMLTTA